MPDDNPYAAPQTIGSPLVPVPTAQTVDGRQLFPEWDTARVTRLADFGRAIVQMTNLCLAFGAFMAIGLTASWMRADSLETRQMILLLAALIVGPLALRGWWGYHRAGWMQQASLLFDCLASCLIVFGVLWGILLCFRGQIHFGLLIPMLGLGGFLLLHSAASFLAHLHARELFGPDRLRLDDLGRESDYRRRHGIG
jgi:hypothetical protein